MKKIKQMLFLGLKGIALYFTFYVVLPWNSLLSFYWPANRITKPVFDFYHDRWGEMFVFMICVTMATTACLYRGLFPQKGEKKAWVFLGLVVLIYVASKMTWRYWRETTVYF